MPGPAQESFKGSYLRRPKGEQPNRLGGSLELLGGFRKGTVRIPQRQQAPLGWNALPRTGLGKKGKEKSFARGWH